MKRSILAVADLEQWIGLVVIPPSASVVTVATAVLGSHFEAKSALDSFNGAQMSTAYIRRVGIRQLARCMKRLQVGLGKRASLVPAGARPSA